MSVAFDDLHGVGTTTVAACTLTGRSRATHYRAVAPPARAANPIPQSQRKKPPQTLSAAERAVTLAALNTCPNADLSIGQVWARRAQVTHPAKVKPELLADGPSQVRSCYAGVAVLPTVVSDARSRAVGVARRSASSQGGALLIFSIVEETRSRS